MGCCTKVMLKTLFMMRGNADATKYIGRTQKIIKYFS
jgi:hypothetical protein